MLTVDSHIVCSVVLVHISYIFLLEFTLFVFETGSYFVALTGLKSAVDVAGFELATFLLPLMY